MKRNKLITIETEKAKSAGARKRAPAPIRVDEDRWEHFQALGREAYFAGIDYSECPFDSKESVKWDGWLIGWWSEYYKERRSLGKGIKG